MRVSGVYVERMNRAREARGLSPDELSRRCGYPLDLVDPLLRGEPDAISEQMNRKLCEVLRLDAAEMWSLAQRDGEARAGPAAD